MSDKSRENRQLKFLGIFCVLWCCVAILINLAIPQGVQGLGLFTMRFFTSIIILILVGLVGLCFGYTDQTDTFYHRHPVPKNEVELIFTELYLKRQKPRGGYEVVGKEEGTDGQKTITEYQEEHTGKWFVKSKLIKAGYTEEDLEEMHHREIRKKSKKR